MDVTRRVWMLGAAGAVAAIVGPRPAGAARPKVVVYKEKT